MKKVLSWVLVLALVLGSFATSFAGDTASSKDFSDAAKIQCVEAVDVMVATGVIKGYPDGTFQPEKTVTRAEMAKMIATIKNGGEDIGDTYAGSCTFADSKDHWAAGYIGYCAAKGIIAGRSADVFDPDATVTGTEAAKMALVALGYKAEAEGLTGADWAANTLDLAKENKLFDDCTKDFAPGKDLSRDNAAQILFNALNADMVKYENGTTVTVGDAQVVVDSDSKATGETLGENAFEDLKKIDEVAKKDNDGNIVKDNDGNTVMEPQTDKFGAPATTWKLDKDEIGTYTQSVDFEFIVKDDTSLDAAIEDYDEDLADDYTAKSVVVNGIEGRDVELGDTVCMYEDEDVDDLYTIVIKHYDAYQITDVDTDVKDKDAKDGVYAYVDIDYLGTYDDDEIAGFDKNTYVEDAVIQVATKDTEIIDSYLAEKVSGEVTKINYSSYKVAIDGKDYEMNDCYYAIDEKLIEVESEYDLFLYNGYVNASLFLEDNSEVYYGVLVDIGEKKADFDGDDTVVVKIATPDGKEVVYTADADKYEEKADVEIAKYTLIEYTLNDDGEVKSMLKYTFDFDNKEMKNGGTIAGKVVSEDVVVFAYDGDDWTIYDYSDIESADAFSAYCCMDDDEIVAMYIKEDKTLEASDDVVAFLTDMQITETKDGYQAEVTYLVDGKEETNDTVTFEDMKEDAFSFASDAINNPTNPVVITFDADGLIKGIRNANKDIQSELQDDFDKDVDVVGGQFGDPWAVVLEKTSTSIDLGAKEFDEEKEEWVVTGKDYQAITGAKVYYVNKKGEFEVVSASKIKKNTEVLLYQTEEDASAWNIVILKDSESVVAPVVIPFE